MHSFRLYRDSMQVDTSPSVSLERGGHRMRAPRVLPSIAPLDYNRAPKSPQSRKPRPLGADLVNRNLVLLLALLTISCITCFAFAYYVYSSRWEHISWRDPFAQANRPMEAIALGRRSWLQEEQGYLAYLPHSGLHNQRIALENALTLARLLNRTLLVPPIRLGVKAIRYLPFDTLYGSLVLAVPDGLEHCGDLPPYITLPVECLDYFDSTTIGWGELFNISQIEEEQRIIHLRTLSPSEYLDFLSPLRTDTLQVKDDGPYRFRFSDDKRKNKRPPSTSKYDESISIAELLKAPQNLIQLGTLFGTSRLLLGEEGTGILASIREKMVIQHETLVAIADSILSRISHPYVGIHLRIGDGSFSDRRSQIIQDTWCRVVQHMSFTAQAIQEVLQLSGMQFTPNSSACPMVSSGVVNTPFPSKELGYHTLATPIFISTDLKDPKTDGSLRSFRQTFPCVYFLSDFQRELEPLGHIQNADGVALSRFYIPFVEAMVVARAELVIGTRGSTFSKFIEETLRPAYRKQSLHTRL